MHGATISMGERGVTRRKKKTQKGARCERKI